MNDPWWEWGIWAFRASVEQANGAGGAIVLDIAPAVGDTMIIISAKGANSGTNSLDMTRIDEDQAEVARYVDVASAASTAGIMPQSVSNAAASASVIDSTNILERLFRGDDVFSIFQTGAGAQFDTLVITIRALLSSSSIPTVSKARSTNQVDVTIVAPTVNKIL